jgi:hypothetical protein
MKDVKSKTGKVRKARHSFFFYNNEDEIPVGSQPWPIFSFQSLNPFKYHVNIHKLVHHLKTKGYLSGPSR